MKAIKILAVVLALFGATVFTIGQEPPLQCPCVALAWDASTDPDVATSGGYNIYYGPAHATYTNITRFGPVTSCIVSNLPPGSVLFLAATAWVTNGTNYLESDYSNEVIYNVPIVQPGTNMPPPTGLFPWAPQANGPRILTLLLISTA